MRNELLRRGRQFKWRFCIIKSDKAGSSEDAVAALSVELGSEEITKLEEPYVAHAIAGFESSNKRG